MVERNVGIVPLYVDFKISKSDLILLLFGFLPRILSQENHKYSKDQVHIGFMTGIIEFFD